MLIDKIKDSKDFGDLKKLGSDYWRKLQENIPNKRALEKIAEAMNLLLLGIQAPKEEREKIIQEINKGRLEKMFEMAVDYDVQETRRIAMQEGIQKGMQEGIKKEQKKVVVNLLKNGVDLNIISSSTEMSIDRIKRIRDNLESQKI